MNHQKIRLFAPALTLAVLLSACGGEPAAASPIETTSLPQGASVAPLVTLAPQDGAVSTQAPADADTPVQTQAPVQTQTPYGVVAQGETVDASYFNDAVFVGDSVSLKLNYYNVSSGALGTAQFLTSGSLGSANALWEVSGESVHPSYQGEKMRVEDAVAQTGAAKLYIMLGMNDIGLYGAQDSVKNFTDLMALILEKSPDLTVYVQSVTPMTATSTLKALTNEKITEYNALIQSACEENGWYYLDIAQVMTGQDGCLPRSYCSDPDDMGIHFTEQACALWADYLKTHTVIS